MSSGYLNHPERRSSCAPMKSPRQRSTDQAVAADGQGRGDSMTHDYKLTAHHLFAGWNVLTDDHQPVHAPNRHQNGHIPQAIDGSAQGSQST